MNAPFKLVDHPIPRYLFMPLLTNVPLAFLKQIAFRRIGL